MSRDFEDMSTQIYFHDDFTTDENQSPYQDVSELKRAQSDGDLLNGELKRKLDPSRSMPLLEKKVQFSLTKESSGRAKRLSRRAEEGENVRDTYLEEFGQKSGDGKKRSRSCDDLSWKTPHIDVKRTVQLLPQKPPAKRSKSADSPRKGILKTKRITQTSTIRVSGSIPESHDKQKKRETTTDESTRYNLGGEGPLSSSRVEQMDYSPYSRRPESHVKMFKLPKRYRVEQDIELESDTKPKPTIFTRKWKSEPMLAIQKTQRRSRSMERLPSEKETKISNFKIDLVKPIDIKPLKPAYSIGDLPFETAIRNEVKFQVKPQRWKSNPELISRDKLTQNTMEDIHPRKIAKEFEAKIVRALPVHLQPLPQHTPAKETPVKATQVKDASMQFTSIQDMRSKGTQVLFKPSPKQVLPEECVESESDDALAMEKASDKRKIPEKLTVPVPLVVDFQKSDIRKEAPKIRRLEKTKTTTHDMKEPRIGEFDLSRVETVGKKGEPAKKQVCERIIVEYMPELQKRETEEQPTATIETCEEHATEVKLKKTTSESEKAKREIQIGRIDELDMDLVPGEAEKEDHAQSRRVKKLKTTHIDYKPSIDKETKYVSPVPDTSKEQLSYRQKVVKEDMTFGRIESTRKFAPAIMASKSSKVDSIKVEEIPFPRQPKRTVKSTEEQTQHKQGLKRKTEAIVKYEKKPKDDKKLTKATKSTKFTGRAEVGHLVIDETFKPEEKVRREPSVGRIENIQVDEKPRGSARFPSQPEIGTFLVKTGTKDEKEPDVGRIVIEEIPGKEQKSTRDVTRREVKDEVVKVRRSDITQVEPRAYTDRVDGARQPRKEKKPEEQKIEPRYIEDKRHRKGKHGETKSRVEKTKFSRSKATAEKVTVTRRDDKLTEHIVEPKISKEQCVGRIVIEEKPEKKDEKPRDVYRKGAMKPRTTEVTRQEMMERSRKVKRDKKPEEQNLDHLHAEELFYDKVQPRTDDTKVSREHVTTEKVTVSRRDTTHSEQIAKPGHPKELDIGRIVIEEIPEEKEDIPKRKVTRKQEVKPRSTVVKRPDRPEVPKTQVKEDVVKVGKLDVDEFKETPLERRRVEERVATYKERVEGARKWRRKDDVIKVGKLDVTDLEKYPVESESRRLEDKATTHTEIEDDACKVRRDDKLMEQKIDRLYFDDLEVKRVCRDEIRPRTEDKIGFRKQVTTENVTVSSHVKAHQEETAKPRYPRELDIGRFMIAEIQEGKQEIPKGKILLREEVKPTSTNMWVTRHELEEVSTTIDKEDVIKVSKLDITELEETPVELRRADKKDTIYTGTVIGGHEPTKEKQLAEQVKEPRHIEYVRYYGDMLDKTKPHSTRTDGKRKEELERPTYRRGQQVGSILVKEKPDEKDGGSRRDYDKDVVERRTTKVIVTREDDVSTPHEKEYVMKVGKLDVHELEKTPMEFSIVEERLLTQNEMMERPLEVRSDDKAKVTSENVTVSRRHTTLKQGTDRTSYSKEIDVGRSVIEEIPDEKEEVPKRDFLGKGAFKPMSSEAAVSQYEPHEVPKTYVTEDVTKVGKPDVTEFEETSVESVKVGKRVTEYAGRVDSAHQVTRDENFKQQRIERLDVEGVDFNKVGQLEIKSRADDTKISREHVTQEKTTVRSSEEIEKLKYTMAVDIEHLVIEEIPEKERNLISKVAQEDVFRPRSYEAASTRRDVQEVPRRRQVKQDVIKVGKLDVTEFEKEPVESKRMQEKFKTSTERMDGSRKGFIISSPKSNRISTRTNASTQNYGLGKLGCYVKLYIIAV